MYSKGHLRAIWADSVLLASGGYAQIYRESSNVPDASGDGAMAALRAGAQLQDLEFVQFHPTTLYLAGVPRLLITEAVRGEGAHIVDNHGTRFVAEQHDQAELAPRDIISQLIMAHLHRPEVDGVFLDLRHLDSNHLAKRFPGVAKSCAAHALDMARDLIPIRPAAHYTVGGVVVDRGGRHTCPRALRGGRSHSQRAARCKPSCVQQSVGGTGPRSAGRRGRCSVSSARGGGAPCASAPRARAAAAARSMPTTCASRSRP